SPSRADASPWWSGRGGTRSSSGSKRLRPARGGDSQQQAADTQSSAFSGPRWHTSSCSASTPASERTVASAEEACEAAAVEEGWDERWSCAENRLACEWSSDAALL